MGLSNNKRGFRKTSVEDDDYSWKFDGVIDIRHAEKPKGQKLIVNYGWYDVWLYVNVKDKPPEPCVWVFTPRLVAEAIIFAKHEGWNPILGKGEFKITYMNKDFNIADL